MRIKKIGKERFEYTFTLIELLLVISIIALLTSMLLPALKKARDTTVRITCANNLKQVYVATMGYATDYDGYIPPSNKWPLYLAPNNQLPPYTPDSGGDYLDGRVPVISNTGVTVCPSTAPCEGTPEAPILTSYSPTKYPNWIDPASSPTYGGWGKSTYDGGNGNLGIAKKLMKITPKSTILIEGELINYVGDFSWKFNMSSIHQLPTWASMPTHANFAQGPVYRHGKSTNLLFKEGNVSSFQFYATFDNDWRINE